tara:strand:+ start:1687 stop:2310 length:624 start_codon:yes stop_codon:yes gene_type:complete
MNTRKNQLIKHLEKIVTDDRVINAIEITAREDFVPDKYRDDSYLDKPLRIGYGQTISQPSIVAIMLQELETRKTDTVLELGTGSGYQTALLSNLVSKVVSVERIPELANSAKSRLDIKGYNNIEIVLSEDKIGWGKIAPYDGIIVSASVPKIPQDLVNQLASTGRMIIPVGSMEGQELVKVSSNCGLYSFSTICNCRFVPLIGEGGW